MVVLHAPADTENFGGGHLPVLHDESLGQHTGLTAAHLERISAGFTNSAEIMDRFRPAVFDGDLLFFSAAGASGNGEHSPEEWRPAVTGGIREVPVDCGHNQMIEPDSLAVVGPALEAYLSSH